MFTKDGWYRYHTATSHEQLLMKIKAGVSPCYYEAVDHDDRCVLVFDIDLSKSENEG
jgi:hypothetical protein